MVPFYQNKILELRPDLERQLAVQVALGVQCEPLHKREGLPKGRLKVPEIILVGDKDGRGPWKTVGQVKILNFGKS